MLSLKNSRSQDNTLTLSRMATIISISALTAAGVAWGQDLRPEQTLVGGSAVYAIFTVISTLMGGALAVQARAIRAWKEASEAQVANIQALELRCEELERQVSALKTLNSELEEQIKSLKAKTDITAVLRSLNEHNGAVSHKLDIIMDILKEAKEAKSEQ